MEVIFKTIKTVGGYYVYDRSNNCIIKLSKEEFEQLQDVELKKVLPEQSSVMKKYQNKGYFRKNTLIEISHPYNCMLKHILSNHIEQLTIQVTQRCNLRCQYCTYGGFYDDHNRVHANVDMKWEKAKAAIDFYLERSMETKELTFGFYGGEPLLMFDLIRQCVEYIKQQVSNKVVHYTITTNGTLLNLQIANYLFENGFSVVISLDGSKKEHDEYRRFPDGSGSSDIVMKNLRMIRDAYPEKFKRIRFNTVLNPKNDYKHLKLYFEEDELIGESDVMTTIVDNKSAESVKFSDEFYRARAFEKFKLYLYMIGKIDIAYVSKLVIADYAFLKQKYQMLINNKPLGCKSHHGGPCIPGGKRLFINAFGEMFPCERVAEKSEVMKIGNLNKGFDMDKVRNLLNVGKITEKECKSCWAINYCSLCCQKADGGDHLSKTVKLPYCKISKENAYYDIAEICVLRELGCTFSEKGLSTYEKDDLSVEL